MYHHSNLFFSYTSRFSDATLKGFESLDSLSFFSTALIVGAVVWAWRSYSKDKAACSQH